MAYEPISEDDWGPMRNLALEIAKKIMVDNDSEAPNPGFEETELLSLQNAHLEFLERKYGPHPWILDIRADHCEVPEEKIRIRKSGLSLVDEEEFDLRGQFFLDLARDYSDGLGDASQAAYWVGKAMAIRDKLTDPDLRDEIAAFTKEIGSAPSEPSAPSAT